MHVHEKRGVWWGIHPKEGKKAFPTEAEAKAWAEDTEAPVVPEPEAEEE